MIKEIMFHELQNILHSKKFIVAFSIVSVLMLLSVALGARNYHSQMNSYNTLLNLNEQEMREKKNWTNFTTKAVRKPTPLQIFVSGVNFDIGRYAVISSFEQANVNHSVYSDDPFYAVFRFLDFSFIAVFVLSLFILVFTYDAVNGEAESGTLKLIFANPVPRGTYLAGKIAGIWCGVLLPLLIPMLLSLALLLVGGVPLTFGDMLSIIGIFGMVLLLGSFFVLLGVLLSVLIRRPAVSFLTALAAWMFFTCIIPRAGILLAGQMVYVPGIQEIKGEQDQYEKQRWDQHMQKLQERWREREAPSNSLSSEERQAFRDKNMWAWMEEDEKDRKLVQEDIGQHFTGLQERLKNNKRELERLALLFARLSPVAAFQLTVMDMTAGDTRMKDRFDDALARYKKDFLAYKTEKAKQSGAPGGIRIMFDSETGLKIDAGRDKGTLDVSGVPRFQPASVAGAEAVSSTLINGSIIGIMSILLFGAAFAGFLRFDMR